MEGLQEVLKEVLRRVGPSPEERGRVFKVVNFVTGRAREEIDRLGVEAFVEVGGSVAKDTWISGDKDIDIFILLPIDLGFKGLQEVGLSIAKAAAGQDFVESYAEHPYIQSYIDGYRVDIVPCFKVPEADKVVSSVDRTVFHTRYVNSRVDERLRDEVRVLKRFMKGIGVYGAEVKTGGFSGYLCEILILSQGGFEASLKEASTWKPLNIIIDIEKHYPDPLIAKRIFPEPLIAIDPVDKSRNVAAALALDKLALFIAASKAFLKKPKLEFFYPPEERPLSLEGLKESFKKRGTDFLFIATSCPKVVLDVLWGQIYKSLDGIKSLLGVYDFKVLDSKAWSNEKSIVIFIFELEAAKIPASYKHYGPFIGTKEYEDKFLEKHVEAKETIAGPWIEGGRWAIYIKRRYINAVNLLNERLKAARLGSYIAKEIEKGFEVYINEEINNLYLKEKEFASFLTSYIKRRPPWL